MPGDTASARYDVAIVGYGPTGITAANFLGAAGLRVVVLERDTDTFDSPRAVSTDEEVLRIWQRIGLVDQLQGDMLSGVPIDYVDDAGRPFLGMNPQTRGNGFAPQQFLYQPALERTLRAGVNRYPNVDVCLGCSVEKVQETADGVQLVARDIAGQCSGDRMFSASYVIAADGGSSTIRTQLGLAFEGSTDETRWLVIDTEVRAPWPGMDRLRFHCHRHRPCVDCPTPLGHHRWEFAVMPGDCEQELASPRGIWRLLEQRGITPQHVRIVRSAVYSHHVRFASQWRAGRIFLAGDAAHVMPPYIGEGMSAGIRDAGNLCWKLAAVVKRELPESVLDSYAAERQPHVRALASASVAFGRLICARNATAVRVRNAGGRLLMRTPVVGEAFRRADWFPITRYPVGFFAGAAPPYRRRGALREAIDPFTYRAIRGQTPPQPQVLTADGERVRFDDVLGQRWVVLHADNRSPDHRWAAAGVEHLRLLPPHANPAAEALVDIDGALTRWLTRHRVTAVALRPDVFVYAAAADGEPLPPPPKGLHVA